MAACNYLCTMPLICFKPSPLAASCKFAGPLHKTQLNRSTRSVIRRVTNTSEEIYKFFKQQGKNMEEADDEITVNDTQVLYPELGSLESRVSKFYLDELFSQNGPDLEETAYWFHTPEEGWKREPTRLKAAQEAPVTFADPVHENWQQMGRIPVDELKEGQVITGTISDIWLYHGLQIDFGYQFDGLVSMTQDQWMQPGLREQLMPGEQVSARVFKVRQHGLYRWPVQLQLLEPASVANQIMPPEEYEPSINHAWAAEQDWSMEQIIQATNRQYQPSQYLMPQNQAEMANEMQMAYGWDVENAQALDRLHPLEERVMINLAGQINHAAHIQGEDL